MIKIISKKKYENLLDRIDDLTLDIDYLKGENDKLEDQVKIFNEDNKRLRYLEQSYYIYKNNKKGSDYCFFYGTDNMNIGCFLDSGEILCFASKSIVDSDRKYKKISKEDFIHDFVRPLIKENRKQKEEIAKLKIELEDTKGFLAQEKACSNALREAINKDFDDKNTLDLKKCKAIEPKKRGRKPKKVVENGR